MQKLKSSLNESLNESLNQRLQAKYPHLELAVLPLSQVNKDNESKRIDSEYFKKEYLENEKIVNSQIRICDFVESKITNIKGLKLNKDFDYLQISDIDTNNGLEYTTTQIDFMHIPDRATYVLQNNDICVSTVRPNRNAVALIKDSKRLVGTSGFCVLRAKNKEVLPEVLYIFCKTKFFITKMMRANTASLYPAVIDSDILKCQIPQFSQDFQLEIEKLVKDSHKALEDSKTLYKEAQNLLYESLGLDFINPLESLMRDTLATSCHTEALAEVSKNDSVDLVDTSAFSKPQYDKVLKSRNDDKNVDCHDSTRCAESRNDENSPYLTGGHNISSPSLAEGARGWVNTHNDDIATKYPHLNISIRQLSQSYGKSGRLDSEYYQSKYDAIERIIKGYQGGYCRLQDLILSYSGGFAFSSDDYLESGDLALIRINNIKNANLDMSNAVYLKNNAKDLSPKDKVKQGDILISMSGSIGLSCLVREHIEAMTNQRILKISIKDFSGEVLVLLLNSIFCKLQFERVGTGGVQTNISSVDILNILIPKIDSTVQEQIASKIQKSFALRKEAKDLLESAKSKVEHVIEQGAR